MPDLNNRVHKRQILLLPGLSLLETVGLLRDFRLDGLNSIKKFGVLLLEIIGRLDLVRIDGFSCSSSHNRILLLRL